jgi:hypothetical protein
VANSAYKTCTAPCITTITFGSNNDTISSPFYDYANDVIYVGDAAGYLHKFNNVFLGSTTPTAAASPWPVQTANKNVSSPVWDSVSQLVYSANYQSNLSEVTSAGSAKSSTNIPGAQNDIQEGPIVDSTAGRVYVFVEGPSTFNGTPPQVNNYIEQYATNFASGGSPLATVGDGQIGTGGSNSEILFKGDFDNAFYTTGTGNLYVCGNTAGDATIYQIPITSGNMGTTATAAAVLTSSNAQCSPVTEIYNTNATNGPFDWIYAGVTNHCTATGGGTAGCITNLIVTQWQASTVYSVNQEILDTNLHIQKVTSVTSDAKSGATHPTWHSSGTTTDNHVTWTYEGTMLANSSASAESGGTSGIVVDNSGGATGASNVYFSTLSGGTAIQASQSAP